MRHDRKFLQALDKLQRREGQGGTSVRPVLGQPLQQSLLLQALQVKRRAHDEIRLEPKVMRVLLFLAHRHGRVVSRRDLEDRVWPRMIVTDDALTNAVIKLRKALGDDARHPRFIETIAISSGPLSSSRPLPVPMPVWR